MPPGIVGTSFLFCVSARLLGPDSTSEIYGPATLPDRRSVGIESETTQTGIDWGAPRVPPRLREARRSRVGESDQFRPLPSQAATCSKRHIACKLPHEEHQFSATISETRFSHRRRPARIYRSRGGAAAVGMFYGCGQHNKRSCVAAFRLSPRQRKHNPSDQLRVHPRTDRNGIA